MTVPRPLSLLCELTYRCNLQCPYCYNPLDLDGYRDEIDTATWQRVIGEAADLGIVQLGFSGGEPTLRRDLETLVATASARGLYTNLITQGTFLDPPRIASLEAAGLDHIQISLQAPERDLADKIAGTVVHERKLEAIARVQNSAIALTLNCVLHRNNHDTIADVIELARAFEPRRAQTRTRQRAVLRLGVSQSRRPHADSRASRTRTANRDGRQGAAGREARDRLRFARLFRGSAQSVHARLGPRIHDRRAERPRDALSRRGGDRLADLRQRPRARLERHLERLAGVHGVSRDRLDA